MAKKRGRLFNFYDHLEAKTEGGFFHNPATPQEYPKAMYHPTGQTYVESPGERVPAAWAPGGFEIVNRREFVIQKNAANAEEAAALRKAGWHDTEAAAVAARENSSAKPAKAANPSASAA